MADSKEDTGSPDKTTETDESNAIFDNDQLEDSVMGLFSSKEETSDAEEEDDDQSSEEQETEEVAEEAATEEEESEDGDDEGPSHEDSEKFQQALDRRISRELKKLRKEHDDKMSQLDERLKEAETPTDALSRANSTMDLRALDKIEEDAEKTIDFVEENPDGLTLNEGKENERFMDRKELLAMRKNARAAIKAAGKRRKFIQEKQANDNEVYEKIPALKDQGSNEYQAVESVYNIVPDLRNHPKGTYLALCILEGDRFLTSPAKPSKKNQKPKKAPKLPDAQEPPKKAAKDAKPKKMDLSQAIELGGDPESLEDALVQHLS